MILLPFLLELKKGLNRNKRKSGRDYVRLTNKTLQLVEFLMKNGSIEFVAVVNTKFKKFIQSYVFYEKMKDSDDHGYSSYIISKRVFKKDYPNVRG